MVGVMIFIIKNKRLMKLGFDELNFVPRQPIGLFKRLKMKRPLCFAKLFKCLAQSAGKSIPF